MQATGEPKYRATEEKYSSYDGQAQIAVNLAPIYADEAGIRHLHRTLTHDRKGSRIKLNEEFAFAQAMPVVLNFLTPRTPDISKKGALLLPSAQSAGKPVTLRYDAGALKASMEKIELSDQGLKSTWANTTVCNSPLPISPAPIARWNWNSGVLENTSEFPRDPYPRSPAAKENLAEVAFSFHRAWRMASAPPAKK